MIRKRSVHVSTKSRAELFADLSAAGFRADQGKFQEVMGTYHWMGVFECTDERLQTLEKLTRDRGMELRTVDRIEYSKEEISAAELLILWFTVRAKGETGPDDGNEYDYSEACPLCLSGARLIPPFRMRGSDLPAAGAVSQTHRLELLLREPLARVMQEIDGSGDWLMSVEDVKSGRRLPWLAVQPRAQLPRMDPVSIGLKHQSGLGPRWDTCPRCGRDCYSMTSLERAVYSRSAIRAACGPWVGAGESFPDAACTWELTGPGTRTGVSVKRQVAQPHIVVSQRVARTLLSQVKSKIVLQPVTVIA